MSALCPQQRSPVPRASGFLKVKGWVVLWGSLVVVILLTQLTFPFPSESSLDAKQCKLTDLLAHLRKRGLQLHVVSSPSGSKGQFDVAYLTEDANATWDTMQTKVRLLEFIHQWDGTVWVGYAYLGTDAAADEQAARWGEHGCRIGRFVFFGDERLLRRIQEAYRQR